MISNYPPVPLGKEGFEIRRAVLLVELLWRDAEIVPHRFAYVTMRIVLQSDTIFSSI
jgi:hypothetical protein